MRFPIGAMTVGDILDRGLKLLLARLPTFYLISLIVQAPLLIYQLAVIPMIENPTAGAAASGNALATFVIGTFLVLILSIILGPIGAAASLHVVAKEFIGERVGIGAALRFALGKFGSLLLVSILVGLTVGVGILLLLIPGLLFLVWYSFAGQVVVVEGLKGTKAMERSKDLTKGFRWRVFGLVILFAIMRSIFLYVVGKVEQSVIPTYEIVRTDLGATIVTNQTNHIISMIVNFFVTNLVESFSAVCLTLFYFDLRIRKEGFDLELAAGQPIPTV